MLICFREYYNIHYKKSNYTKMKNRTVTKILDKTVTMNFVNKIVYCKKYKLFVFIGPFKKALGFLIYKKYKDDYNRIVYYIPLLGVDPAFRNKGYGREILDSFTQRVRRENVNVYIQLHSLHSCKGFYERYGFKSILQKDYVHNEQLNEDDILLEYEVPFFK
jgi:ribosomal protein S18 acetylase RimI-like enzyme